MLHVRCASCSLITLTGVKMYLLTIIHILIASIRRWCSWWATWPSTARHGTSAPEHASQLDTPIHCSFRIVEDGDSGSINCNWQRHQRLHRKLNADQLCSSFSCVATHRRRPPLAVCCTRMRNRVYVFIDKIDINRTFKAIRCKIVIACKLPTVGFRCLSSAQCSGAFSASTQICIHVTLEHFNNFRCALNACITANNKSNITKYKMLYALYFSGV